MQNWIRQLMPWLLILSLGANVWLAVSVWDRDSYANRITWHNQTMAFMKYTDWSQHSSTGEILDERALTTARETLEQFQSLPHSGKRMENSDRMVIWHFLHYALNSAHRAEQERAAGGLTPESERRIGVIREGLHHMVVTAERSNRLSQSGHPWNHAEWRAMWQEMAAGLSRLDLVPLE